MVQIDGFMVGSIIWNTGLVAVAGYFIKKWMGAVELKGKHNAELIAKHTQWTQDELAKFTAMTTSELKDCIHENRTEYKEKSAEIIDSIKELSAHVSIANGRTTKNELATEKLAGVVKTQIALCKERNSGRRSTDHCMGSEEEMSPII